MSVPQEAAGLKETTTNAITQHKSEHKSVSKISRSISSVNPNASKVWSEEFQKKAMPTTSIRPSISRHRPNAQLPLSQDLVNPSRLLGHDQSRTTQGSEHNTDPHDQSPPTRRPSLCPSTRPGHSRISPNQTQPLIVVQDRA